MSNENLGIQLGELTGQIKALLPVLERQADELAELNKDVARAEEAIRNLRDQQTKFEERAEQHWLGLYKKVEDIQTLKTRVEDMKREDDKKSKRSWGVWLIVISAVVGTVFNGLMMLLR